MSVKQNPTISLGFVTSVVNLKRQDMHLYRASRSGPVQLYGIPCSGAHETPLLYCISARCILLFSLASRQRSQQKWAARGKVGRGPRKYLRREYHSPVISYRGCPYLRQAP